MQCWERRSAVYRGKPTFVVLQDLIKCLAVVLPSRLLLLLLPAVACLELLLRGQPFAVAFGGLVEGAAGDEAGGHYCRVRPK